MGKDHCEVADGNVPTKSDRPNVGTGTSSSAGMGSTYIPPSILPADKRASYLSGSGKGPLRQEDLSASGVADRPKEDGELSEGGEGGDADANSGSDYGSETESDQGDGKASGKNKREKREVSLGLSESDTDGFKDNRPSGNRVDRGDPSRETSLVLPNPVKPSLVIRSHPASNATDEKRSSSSSRSSKKSRKRHRRSRSQSPSSSSEDEELKEKRRKNRSFHAKPLYEFVSPSELNKWHIGESRAASFNRHAIYGVSQQGIKHLVIDPLPCPDDVLPVPRLDSSIKSWLSSAGKDILLSKDKQRATEQRNIRDAMGPLCKAWKLSANNEQEDYFHKTAICLGRSFHAITGQRQLSIMSHCVGYSRANQLQTTDIAKDLASDTEFLFGRKAKSTLDKLDMKASKAIFFGQGIKVDSSSSNKKGANSANNGRNNNNNQKPFSKGPSKGGASSGNGNSSGNQQRGGKIFVLPSKTSVILSSRSLLTTGSKVGSPASPVKVTRKPISPSQGGPQGRGKNKIPLKKLVTPYTRPLYLRLSKRIQNPSHRTSSTFSKHLPSSKVQRCSGSPRQGSRFHVGKESHQGDRFRKERQGLLSSVRDAKKGRGFPSNCQSKEGQCGHSLQPFSNGGIKECAGSDRKRRLSCKDRSQRRVLLDSPPQRIEKTGRIPMEGHSLRIPSPLLRNELCPPSLHETLESPDLLPKKDGSESSHLSGRPHSLRKISARSRGSQGLGDCIAKPVRVYHKLEKINSYPLPVSGLSGNNGELGGVDFFSSRGEDRRPSVVVRQADLSAFQDPRPVKDDRKANLNHARSVDGPPSGEISAEMPNRGLEGPGRGLRSHSFSGQECQARTGVVVSEPQTEKGKTLVDLTSGPGHPERCSREWRLGSPLCGFQNGRPVETGRERSPHKCEGDNCGRPCHQNLCEMETAEVVTSAGGQHGGSSLHCQPRGHQEPRSSEVCKENLGVFVREEHSDLSRMAPLTPEQGSGRGIQKRLGLLGVATGPNSLPSALPISEGCSNDRSVRFQNLSSSSTVHDLEGGPRGNCSERIAPGLDGRTGICLPSLPSDRESSSKAEETRNRFGLSLSHLAVAALVVENSRNGDKSPSQASFEKRPSFQSKRGDPPTSGSGTKSSSSGSMAALRRRLETDNLSEKSIQLISNSRRASTRSNYESIWSQFCGWCSKRGADPVHCPISTVLDYLSDLHHGGSSLSLIKSHRSAISAFHAQIDGLPVGKCENTSLLIRGIGNSKPIVHKYVPVWDVSKVLDYVKARPEPELSDLKFLSQKLVTLLAITSLHRGMELHALSLDLMSRFDDRIEFLFPILLKHSKPGKKDPPSVFHEFPSDKSLCPKESIIEYLEVTHQFRPTPDAGPLFISYRKPHTPVTKQTLCRWVKDFLSAAGIAGYTTHSTRSAGSSKACSKGVVLTDILSRGNWSNRTTFEKFYKKDIATPALRVQKAVLL